MNNLHQTEPNRPAPLIASSQANQVVTSFAYEIIEVY
jgi:hypothetical protein